MRETFVIVEQDIVPWPGALAEIYNCEHRFCMFWTPHWKDVQGGWTYAHGVVKLGAALMHAIPCHFDDYEGDRHWSQFDWNLTKHYGQEIHYHWPPVTHLSPIRFDSVKLVWSTRGEGAPTRR